VISGSTGGGPGICCVCSLAAWMGDDMMMMGDACIVAGRH